MPKPSLSRSCSRCGVADVSKSSPTQVLVATLALLLIGLVLLAIAAGPARCHGQCGLGGGQGMQECQEMCLKAGFCPAGGER